MSRRASITITGKSFTATGKAANNLFNALKEASMAKRVKPVIQVPVISSVEDADAVLAEIAARKRQIELHEISLREGVDALKAECTAKCEPHKIDITAREQALVQFALSRRDEIFKTRKSVDLTFGTFGFRASSAIKTLRRVTWEQVLNLVKERGLPCVRTKEDVDKEALRGLDPETLSGLGCKLVQEDTFFYELAETDLASNQ